MLTPDETARLQRDPRTLHIEITDVGDYWFYHCPLGDDIAEVKHGYRALADEKGTDTFLRILWIANLPFAPERSYEEFRKPFLLMGYDAINELGQLLAELQLPRLNGSGEGKSTPKPWKRLP